MRWNSTLAPRRRCALPLHKQTGLVRRGDRAAGWPLPLCLLCLMPRSPLPPQSFEVILDTGSSVTFVTCSSCRRCGRHKSGRFDPSASNTSAIVGCASPDCGPRFRCDAGRCSYFESYKEGSSSGGYMVRDRESRARGLLGEAGGRPCSA
jgi:hypothetical protein